MKCISLFARDSRERHDSKFWVRSSENLEPSSVSPGKQKISLWHETLGALKKQVTVPPQGNLAVTFEYP